MPSYEAFIGLEIHIHLQTQSKLFCSCRAHYGDTPNTNVCPVCLGYPGVLPSLNREAVKQSFMVCRALNCTLSESGVFDRKNYFYPDMTKNYQISQFRSAFGTEGWLEFENADTVKRARIHDVHLEEDAGKMIHEVGRSLIDYNRAGSSLLEIVTEPDFKTGEEAEAFLQSFRKMVRYLGVCDGNMEEGSLRCDANVSVNRQGRGLGQKVEIKNMNSFRFVKKALNYEIKRQRRALKTGNSVVQETRLWDEEKNVSLGMRSKEFAHDYRYFPEPDLPPFSPDQTFLEEVETSMVELPLYRKQRFMKQYGLHDDQASYLCDEKETADFFEAVVAHHAAPDLTAKWIKGNLAKQLNRRQIGIDSSPVSAEGLASLLSLLEQRTIHGNIAENVLAAMFDEDKDPSTIIEEKGWDSSSNSDELKDIVEKIMQENPQVVQKIKDGDNKPRGFIVGQVMSATGGTADPQLIQKIISDSIEHI
ncbi:MAG: Asp-tRNA(Asn)/Glu-tRNA(Gln) amidotransferase subunit GatB [Spirochaetia bacterium]